jgi:hypothetical protein
MRKTGALLTTRRRAVFPPAAMGSRITRARFRAQVAIAETLALEQQVRRLTRPQGSAKLRRAG